MTIALQIRHAVTEAMKLLFPGIEFQASAININSTKPEFEGDYTVVLFPFVKLLKTRPDLLGNQLGEHLVKNSGFVSGYNVVSGFLNLSISESYWISFLLNHFNDIGYGAVPGVDERIMIEYSSPNTNKPLHFGHLRNIFLGAAVAEVLKKAGKQVIKANLINDRGIHICKSMVAWIHYANGATPGNTGTKGDHFVGDYYVKFNEIYKKQITALLADGVEEARAEKEAPIMLEAQDMLRKWEAGDQEVRQLWQTMNGWVYEGFDVTYKDLGITFDKMYYESNTYLLGKNIVEEGLQKGALYARPDGSVWVDLTADGLDEKLLLRSDGTSVYMTQDVGTAKLKYDDYKLNKSVYVIGDEQNYHMQVLKLIMKKLGEPCADGIYHLSYGMVELPTGKMKSREGTVVDADDMVAEMINLARIQTEQSGKTEGFTQHELEKLYNMIGLGALKFYLLRVEPRKKMIFNPQESIDLHGFTATFIQYAHARICSILRKEGLTLLPNSEHFQAYRHHLPIDQAEKDLITCLEQFPMIIEAAADELNPSELCNYSFKLAQLFNTFYDKHSIANAENEEKKQLRIMIVVMVAMVLRNAMGMLGIKLPEKM